MVKFDDWREQDPLHMTWQDWRDALYDPNIFNPDAIRMIRFVYEQPNHQSTATEIARAMSTPNLVVHPNKVCAVNRTVSKKLFSLHGLRPQMNEVCGNRYWNVLFDGVPDAPLDMWHHFIWRLRPELSRAIHEKWYIDP